MTGDWKTVYADVGDDPPQASLLYGLNVLEGLACIPPNSVNMVATSPPYWSLRDYGVPKQTWGGDPKCEHDWGGEIKSKPQTGGSNPESSTLGSESWGNGVSPEGVIRSNIRSHVAARTSSFCLKCNAWHGCLGLEPNPTLFVEHIVEIGRGIHRVLHESGTFWLNLGDSYMSHAAKDLTNLGGREGERLKDEAGYSDTVIVGKPKVEGLKDKDLVGVPWRVALALQADGWWLRNDIIWQKSNAMPSSVTDRMSCKYEHIFLFAKQAKYFFDLHAVRVPHTYGTHKPDGSFEPAQVWHETVDVDRKLDDDEHRGGLAGSPRKTGRGDFNESGKNPGDIWTNATAQYKGAHFAVWPPALVERMIRAGTSEKGRCPNCLFPWKRIIERKSGGDDPRTMGAQRRTIGWEPTCECGTGLVEPCVVLDTFSGSGTTGVVAMANGRHYLGLDLNEEYLPLAEARLSGRKAPQPDDDPDLIGDLFT